MARAGGAGLAGGPPPGPPKQGNSLPPSQNPSPNKAIEEAFQRGKFRADESGLLARVGHRILHEVRETFVPQHELKGSDRVQPGKSRTRFFAPAVDRIRTLHSQARDEKRRAQDIIGAIFKGMSRDDYDLTNRYLYARDAHENVLRGIEHRPGFDARSVSDEVNRLAGLVKNNQRVQLAIDSYRQIMHGMRDLLINEDLMSPDNPRDWFYPHMLTDFDPNTAPTFLGMKVPRVTIGGGMRYKEPGSLKERKGSARDINTNLINTMERYMTDVLIQVKKRRSLIEIGKKFDISSNPKHGYKLGQQGQIPAGYREWDPNLGYARLRAGTVSERYLGELIDFGGLDKLADVYGFKKADFIRELASIGITDPEGLAKKLGASTAPEHAGPKYVIPEELWRTMDQAIDQLNKAELRGLSEHGVRFWKTLVLNLAPVRYNFRNLIGDTQRMFVQFGGEAFQPQIWQDVIRDVSAFYRQGKISPLIQEMLDGGITSSTRIQSEYALSDVNPHLRHLEGLDTGNLKKTAATIWRVLKYIPEASAAREDIVRGVILEMNKRRMANGKEMLSGVADRELIRGLIDSGEIKRAANYIARKSLLDYGDFTPRENKWRNTWLPFYAWASGNFSFWAGLTKHARRGKGGGDQLARGSATAVMKGVAATAVILSSIRAWNDLVMGEYEEHLPENIKKTSHIILPDFKVWQETGEFKPIYDKEGKVKVWQTADALDDFLTFVGLDHLVPEAMSVARGTLTKEEMFKRQREHSGWGPGGYIPGKGAARAVLNQIGPREQLLVQGVLGKRLFPDPFHPSDIPLEQRASSVRDIFGLGALPGIEGVVGAAHPGGEVFQPTTKLHDIPRQLGFRSVQEPSILQEGGLQGKAPLSPFEADLVKRIQQKQFELRDLEGRMKRQLAEKSNRQLPQEEREAQFQQQLLVMNQLVEELKELASRLTTLQRTTRFHNANP